MLGRLIGQISGNEVAPFSWLQSEYREGVGIDATG